MKLNKADKILFVWLIIVLIAIAWPSPEIPEIDKIKYSDKIAHVLMFGIVTFLANGSLAARGIGQKSAFIISLMAGAAYAGLAEIIQIFVPGRDCSLYDFYAGAIGAVLALIVIYFRKSMKETGR
jgi:polysaccharide biosynthesis protein VpsQ